jgi:AcrR family transcriptional regulator
MAASDVLVPAPGRGQYDRRQPREKRMSEQRERLVAATAVAAVREAAPAVSSIVNIAGVGRNTFYEYFDDVKHALEAVETATARRLDELLRNAERTARTPVERWRAIARAWLGFAEEEPFATLLVLAVDARNGPTSRGARVLEAALGRSLETLRLAGVSAPPAGPERVLALSAVGEAFARAVARGALPVENEQLSPAPAAAMAFERDRLERSLVDVAVRLLR